jgi:AAHS family 4-hydroxybenzoate transporter-like MFS transporter
MSPAASVEIEQFFDRLPLSRHQLLVAILCAMVLFMDGFDAQAMGFVAPALVGQLHIARGSLGPVFSSGLVGIMIGALVFGPLADRFGRKPVLVFCTVLFGLCSLFTATAASLTSLLAYRLITGFGLGGAMPNAVALTSEFTPRRLRATAVTLMFVGFSMGAAFGGFAAAALITRFGWQSVFLTGGALPCGLAVLLIVLLPESIRFLVMKGSASCGGELKEDKKIARALAKIAPGLSIDIARMRVIETPPAHEFVVKQLFIGGRMPMTLLIWVIFFMSLLDLYFLNAWLPTVIHDAGIVLEKAIILTALFQVGGALGSLIIGRLLDRFLSFRVLACAYLLAGVFVLFIGAAEKSLALLAITIFAAGCGIIGGQSSANALAAEYYPTSMRSTGVGWALGIGRIGSIAGPILGGFLLSFEQETRHVFWAAAIPVLIACAAGFLASRVNDRQQRRAIQI